MTITYQSFRFILFVSNSDEGSSSKEFWLIFFVLLRLAISAPADQNGHIKLKGC